MMGIMFFTVMLSGIMLNAVMLSVIKLSDMMLSATAPTHLVEKSNKKNLN
jgi:hypothetical protein